MTTLEFCKKLIDWDIVSIACASTINKHNAIDLSDEFKIKLLKSEHSPIRCLTFAWKWIDLPYYVSVHFVRHKFGIEHYVRSQREDRTGVSRAELPQGALIEHMCVANIQSIINISRKRLCKNASQETRYAWELVVNSIKLIDPILKDVLVPDCIYRGECKEIKSCFKKS